MFLYMEIKLSVAITISGFPSPSRSPRAGAAVHHRITLFPRFLKLYAPGTYALVLNVGINEVSW